MASGQDVFGCGVVTVPCASIVFALASAPGAATGAPLTLILSQGLFGPSSCGSNVTRDLTVVRVGGPGDPRSPPRLCLPLAMTLAALYPALPLGVVCFVVRGVWRVFQFASVWHIEREREPVCLHDP